MCEQQSTSAAGGGSEAGVSGVDAPSEASEAASDNRRASASRTTGAMLTGQSAHTSPFHDSITITSGPFAGEREETGRLGARRATEEGVVGPLRSYVCAREGTPRGRAGARSLHARPPSEISRAGTLSRPVQLSPLTECAFVKRAGERANGRTGSLAHRRQPRASCCANATTSSRGPVSGPSRRPPRWAREKKRAIITRRRSKTRRRSVALPGIPLGESIRAYNRSARPGRRRSSIKRRGGGDRVRQVPRRANETRSVSSDARLTTPRNVVPASLSRSLRPRKIMPAHRQTLAF